ncbi:septal ring lytic transglycosylase RlpA [Aliidiomarina iranensis]|uniref:Endolytic peptidoglycan transglycosylase RlpA n=1 Tax=Aliidiomarina iranensis TaxID=1434071 RepID=A0A432VX06_9GAMM|nr:septal ring lytic transglycosylase RlpA family protein [Aliidiomarina iranensis]RUO21199.1 septal ring lytic transglycosylase RlpA [Aliidiomarina iranensis]
MKIDRKPVLAIKLTFIAFSLLTLNACSSSAEQRYRMYQDQAPARTPTAAELNQIEPRYEPISRVGNLPYEVNGIQYFVLESNQDYSEEGIASWYGQKFHGHRTSMGEFFDMYGLTAAHKTLPLPSWVRVTNLDNDKQIVVRVNDRGPFHPDRIIDLSYAAAYALGIDKTGTGRVHLETITPNRNSNVLLDQSANYEYTHFIQIAAARDIANLQSIQLRLQEIYALDATTEQRNGLNRLLLGPFTEQQTMQWINRLQADGFNGIFRVPINQTQ